MENQRQYTAQVKTEKQSEIDKDERTRRQVAEYIRKRDGLSE